MFSKEIEIDGVFDMFKVLLLNRLLKYFKKYVVF